MNTSSRDLWRAVVAHVVLALGCAGSKGSSSQDTVPEPRATPWVEEVDIVGNEALSDDDIIDGLSTRPPSGILTKTRERLDPLLVEVDRERIEAYYKQHGYFDAQVTDVEVTDLGDDEVRVVFHVQEGEPTRVARVQVEGLPPELRDGAAWDHVRDRVLSGDAYDHAAYLEAKDYLRGSLAARGYAHVKVDGTVEVDRERRRAEVTFEVDTGPVVRFGDIIVTGLDEIPESTVRARAPFEPGDVYDPDLIQKYQGRLYELGYFRVASVGMERAGRPARADVIVRVAEGFTRELRLGGGFAADDLHWEVRARGSYIEVGFMDPLTRLRLDVRPAYTWLRGDIGTSGFGGEATAELERRDLIVPLTRGVVRAVYRVTELEAYTSHGPGGRLAFSKGFLDERLTFGLGWELHRLSFPSIADAIGPALREELRLIDPYRVAYFDQFLVYDGRDIPLDPRTGYYVQLRVEEGGNFAGGEFAYVRGTAEVRAYVPAAAHWVVAARARYARTLDGELPITQRYFSGGASHHRGFAQRQLAPYAGGGDTAQIAIGGEALAEGSLEVRYDAFEYRDQWVGFTAFTDAGDVSFEPGGIELGDLHWAVGLGLRYNTPIGPLRFDVARRVTNTEPPYPAPGDVWAWHLSLGEAF